MRASREVSGYRKRMSAVPKEAGVSPVVEDYLKAIYKIQADSESAVSTNALARSLQVSPASASEMVRRLAEAGFVEHTRYRGVSLSASGRLLALGVIRRHRLVELYLSEALGMSWDRVHDHAEVLEHAVSEELEELIAAKLGHPVRDPHGDPIPTRDGRMPEETGCRLSQLPVGAEAVLVRVSDADPQMLRHLSGWGVSLGDRVEVLERQPFGGGLQVRFAERTRMVGDELADAIHVARRAQADDGAESAL
jgi:DtxR family transcriptional regulator, Mn-dependent transcriptional regulator